MHLDELKESMLPSEISGTPFLAREPLTDTGLSFFRRATKDGRGHVYFLVNHSPRAVNEWIPLITAGGAAVTVLDPLTGASGVAPTRASSKNYWGGTQATREIREVYVQLEPGESLFISTVAEAAATRGAWKYLEPHGQPIALDGEWRVSFTEGGPTLPTARSMKSLHSWAEDDDEAAQSFGGTARYETSFTLPAGAKADEWQLDLGDVRETARVFVNGREVSRVWSLPARTRVGAALKSGPNMLVLEVTSTAANRIRDLDRRHVAWKNFHEINFVNLFYKPFDASTWKLQPCGLLGPVTLTPLQVVKP
jgi:hypothetical protein